MCRDSLTYCHQCCHYVSVSPAPEVGDVLLPAKALAAVTFISTMRQTRDDVHVDCPSGGHTTEIIRLMESLSAVYTPRHYVIADTDRISEDKVCTFEASRQSSKSQVHTHTHTRFISCSLMSHLILHFHCPDPFENAKKIKMNERICKILNRIFIEMHLSHISSNKDLLS